MLLTVMRVILSFSLATAATVPASPVGAPNSLPPSMLDSSAEEPLDVDNFVPRRVDELRERPAWVIQLQSQKILSYFDANGKISEIKKAHLLSDAAKLHTYFESGNRDNGFQNFFTAQLRPTVHAFSVRKFAAIAKDHEASGPLEQWTLETFVVNQQLDFLSTKKNYFQKSLGLITGAHLKGASQYAIWIVLLGATSYACIKFGSFGSFIVGNIIGSIRSGPMASIANALSSWFVTPTTEMLKVKSARFSGPAEQFINKIFDTGSTDAINDENNTGTNSQPRIADVAEDGMNFANMTREDQIVNWKRNLRIWVAVAKRFGQLLRDTHHAGRFLMMISWTDEQAAASMIETMDSKLVSLTIEGIVLLTPYKTAFLARGEIEKKNELDALYEDFQRLCRLAWIDPNVNSSTLGDIQEKLLVVRAKFINLGVSERDLRSLVDLQIVRTRAVETLVMAVALNEARSFGTAEANRNLDPEARRHQRAARKGLHLQTYVDEYLPLVQHQLREMGYQITGSSIPISTDFCKNKMQHLLDPSEESN